MSEIVERLRAVSHGGLAQHYSPGTQELCSEAADEIDHLRAEVEAATILIYDLAGLELGSAERAMTWLDEHPLPAPPVEAKSEVEG